MRVCGHKPDHVRWHCATCFGVGPNTSVPIKSKPREWRSLPVSLGTVFSTSWPIGTRRCTKRPWLRHQRLAHKAYGTPAVIFLLSVPSALINHEEVNREIKETSQSAVARSGETAVLTRLCGSVINTFVPLATALRISSDPSCSSAIRLLSVRPSPVPSSWFRV